MKNFLKIVCVILPVAVMAFIGFGLRTMFLNRRIAELTETYNHQKAIADSMVSAINVSDTQSVSDISFMNVMFDEIFTFYNVDDFRTAKQSAKEYGLPDIFIDRFYDMSELNEYAYAESLIDVMCSFSSADYYLLGRQDNVGYYIVSVELSTVKYSGNFHIVLFVALNETGDINKRVSSVIYYNAA